MNALNLTLFHNVINVYFVVFFYCRSASNTNRDYFIFFFFEKKNIDYNRIVITGRENIQTILHRFVGTKSAREIEKTIY